ncbi:solute carrier family 15 member 4-like [Lineus longissimus]|uniref:solute carrier family 15 member 4-like n=1 Tax=Lineus longissimus TaxID=88925 RepID=UPI00315DAA8B
MASFSYERLGESNESTSFSRNKNRRDSLRRSYGANDQTRHHGSETDQQISLADSRRPCQRIGFDRSIGMLCIVLHESCYSAAFYMLVPGLYYMRDGGPLKYTDNQAAAIILVFTGFAFFLPLIGGIIGDIALGRYKAILYGAVMQFLGMVILLIYAILVYVDNTGAGPQLSIPVAKFLFITSLCLIALGLGFNKANVTIFGAGQLYDTTFSAQKIQSYYRWYMFAINLGRLLAFCPISMFLLNYVPVPPKTSHNTSTVEPTAGTYHKDILAIVANVIQVVFVGAGIFIFMIGKARYKMIKPSGGNHMYYIFCFTRHDRRMNELAAYNSVHKEYRDQMNIYKRAIFRLTLIMAALISLYAIYEAVAYQKISIFMLQFIELSQPIGITVHLPLPFMNAFSCLVVVFSVPLLECLASKQQSADDVPEAEIDDVIAQWAKDDGTGNKKPSSVMRRASISKYFGSRTRNFSSISGGFNADALNEQLRRQIAEDISITKHRRDLLVRMGIGLICAAIVALCAGILETMRKKYTLSVFCQVPQYVIMGIGEVAEISAYEFASTESLPGLQGFTIGMFISTYGLGCFIAYFCYVAESGSLIDLKDLNDIQMEDVYFGHSVLMILVTLAFTILARQYLIEHKCRLEEPKCPYSADTEEGNFA